MTAIKVWSEQSGETLWHDCPQSSYLMILMYGGAAIFNAYTWQERERFEDAEGLPESEQEKGLVLFDVCDKAARVLYGVQARDLPEADLSAMLLIPGTAIALSGQGPGLPGGYLGPHCVCVLPVASGGLDVYNPLSPMGTGPSHATVAAILAWHRALPNDIRYVREGEFQMSFDIGMRIGTTVLTKEHSAARVNGGANVDHIPPDTYDVFARGIWAGSQRLVIVFGGVACGLTDGVDCTFVPVPAVGGHTFTVTRDDGAQVAKF